MLRCVLLIIIIFVQNCWGENLVSLENYWPNLNKVSVSDDLNLKMGVGKKFQLLDDSKWCLIAGKHVELEKKTVYRDGQWFVGEGLLQELAQKGWLEFEENNNKTVQGPIVVIDAGHGGKDPGAIGMGGLREKDVVLDIAKRVYIKLKNKNIRVKMTRDRDVFVDLHERCRFSNKWGAGVFVSIHCNSHGRRDMNGYQLYRMHGKINPRARAIWSRKHFRLEDNLPSNIRGEKKFFTNFESLFKWKDIESLTLSRKMNNHFAYRKTSIKTMPEKNLCVLRETFAPSILVETDFISNLQMETEMQDERWRERSAKEIVDGILSYLGLGPNS